MAELVVVATPCCPLSAEPAGVKGLTGRETMLPSVERNLLTFDLASASPSSSSSAYRHTKSQKKNINEQNSLSTLVQVYNFLRH